MNFLDFEHPIAELLSKINELKQITNHDMIDIQSEIDRLERKASDFTRSIFKKLTAWQIVQLARHPMRPHASDYINKMIIDFDELHGDRSFSDDKALIGGIGLLGHYPVMILGQEKGRNTVDKIKHNFGMMHPEGYRKAKRLALLAEKFHIPLITLIDTPGAYPGVGADSRGQSEAIAQNLKVFSSLKIPIINVIIGEGCSGGALGIGVGDRLLMMEYAYFATISPEGCASILFKDSKKASEAAEIMGITAKVLFEQGIVDDIIEEPLGGAHRDSVMMISMMKEALIKELDYLLLESTQSLLERRYEKILSIGSHGSLV